MSYELAVLLATAASIGFIHTLFGPDHYLPFIVMSQSGRWSLRKTTVVTLLCGVGHILGSVLLGTIGIAFGITVARVEAIESWRNGLAAWALIAFGLVYCAWGLRTAVRNRRHQHVHSHEGGVSHEHDHAHGGAHLHAHAPEEGASLTPWVLFTIFLFGPCEPLIPLLMYPAATGHPWEVVLVTVVFGAITIATMTSIVLLSVLGVGWVPASLLTRYSHALAGAMITLCGVSVLILG